MNQRPHPSPLMTDAGFGEDAEIGTEALYMLGIGVWLVVLFAPPLLAFWFWRTATQRSHGWIAHVLFLPCAVAPAWLFLEAMEVVCPDNGDEPPWRGIVLAPLFLTFVGSTFFYYTALGWRLLCKAFCYLTNRSS